MTTERHVKKQSKHRLQKARLKMSTITCFGNRKMRQPCSRENQQHSLRSLLRATISNLSGKQQYYKYRISNFLEWRLLLQPMIMARIPYQDVIVVGSIVEFGKTVFEMLIIVFGMVW
jgi:hypothetical protein